MIKPNPFTPQSGWEPKIFGGREDQVQHYLHTLEEAVTSRSNHMVIIGQWGIGKTSLLKQFKKISQEQGYLASFCPISQVKERASSTAAVNLIMQEILNGFPQAVKEVKFAKQKLQPQVLFTKFLLELWTQLDTKLAVILLDDVQNLAGVSVVIDLLRAVLSKEEVITQTRYLFVLASTTDGWENFINKHDPVGRFFRRREMIGNLTPAETHTVIISTLQNTGVSFDQEIFKEIYRYTQGHPYELQLLASHLFAAQLQGKVTMSEWLPAFKNTLRELGKDYFQSLFERASDREKEVLLVLAEAKAALPQSEIRRIMIVEKHAKNFPVANIKNFLYRLHDKGLIKRQDNGDFQILDPIFGEYVKNNI
jgi:predicted ATPase